MDRKRYFEAPDDHFVGIDNPDFGEFKISLDKVRETVKIWQEEAQHAIREYTEKAKQLRALADEHEEAAEIYRQYSVELPKKGGQ